MPVKTINDLAFPITITKEGFRQLTRLAVRATLEQLEKKGVIVSRVKQRATTKKRKAS